MLLEKQHTDNPYYGHRRLAFVLWWGKKKTRRIMKKFGISARGKKRRNFVKPEDRKQADMHGRSFKDVIIWNPLKKLCPIAPNIVWRSDFTHIIYRGIHLHLATIIDDYTKEVVGYALAFHHRKELILEALNNACKNNNNNNNNNIFPHYFHSDQGSEYKSYEVLDFLYQKNIIISMSSKASPWQNGWQESFYGRFKTELWDLCRFDCIEEVILKIHQQIQYYNNHRIHTSIMSTPVKFKKNYALNYHRIKWFT